MTLAIGVDIGGTKVAFAVADRTGAILAEHTIPTHAHQPVDTVLDRIAAEINRLTAAHPSVQGIGIGIPGPIDTDNGVVMNAVNLGWRGVPIIEGIQARLKTPLPIAIENDVHIGGIGEHLFGAAQGVDDYIYLSIGTGLGGCALVNNRILHGATYAGMEVGHISLDPNGRLCTCGQRGCVEMYISGKGITAGAKEYYAEYPDTRLSKDDITSPNILQLAREGDALCLRTLDDAAHALGVTCAWCTMIFNPTLIILGGGFAHAVHDLIYDKTIAVMRAHALPASFEVAQVVLSRLTNAAVGASALVWHTSGETTR